MTTSILNLSPYVTEKTSRLLSDSKFVFLLRTTVNKIEIARYIENEFGVNIKKVNTTKKIGKKTRRGRILGKRSDYQKVIVTLKDDKNIQKLKDLF